MIIQELIDILQDFPPDTEVRLMTQKNWPFEYSIAGTTSTSELDQCKPRTEEDESTPREEPEVIYLVEGEQLGYGNKNAWNVCS